jgi:PAS domain S-box-containing protein
MDGAGLDSKQFRKLLNSAVMLPPALALILATVLLVEVLYLLSFHRWVERADQVLKQTYELERLLADQESGRRGFIITGDESFLDRYNAATVQAPGAADALAKVLQGDDVQTDRLRRVRELYDQWARYASEMIDSRRAGKDVTDVVRAGRGKALSDSMRAELTALIDREEDRRQERSAAMAVASWIVLGTAGGVTILLGAVIGITTRRRVLKILRSHTVSTHKLAQQTQALRESEDRYRRLVDLSPEGVFIHSDGKWAYVNHALMSILGAESEDQLVGREVMDFVHPEDRERVRERLRIMNEEQREVPLIEERLVRIDGMPVWVEIAAAPFQYQGKQGVQGVVRDITVRVEADTIRRSLETERQELIEKLQLIIDRMPIACCLNDLQYRFTYWNPAAERMFGYKFDEVKGKTPFGIITPFSVQPLIEQIFRQLQDQKAPVTATAENMTKDGRTILCSWVNSGLWTTDGRLVGFLSMAQDVTELRRSEMALARAQQLAHMGSWEWDVPAGRIRWSDEVGRILGVSGNSREGDVDVLRYVHPEDADEVRRQTTDLLKRGNLLDIEHRVLRADGQVRWIHSRTEVTRSIDGSPLLIFGTILDITDRKQAEQELRQLNEDLQRRIAERTAQVASLAAELSSHRTDESPPPH